MEGPAVAVRSRRKQDPPGREWTHLTLIGPRAGWGAPSGPAFVRGGRDGRFGGFTLPKLPSLDPIKSLATAGFLEKEHLWHF